MENRREKAQRIRHDAAKTAHDRDHPRHMANGDEERYASELYPMSFTKGLEHDVDTGLIENSEHFLEFRKAIDDGYVDPFTTSVTTAKGKKRKWEAPTAGFVFSLQGPDAQAVTMAPAPGLGSVELAYEMAEVYELAILRDKEFKYFDDHLAGDEENPVEDSVQRLNEIGYNLNGSEGRKRIVGANGWLTPGTVFRGSSHGVDRGPYVSQFLLLGSAVDNDNKDLSETRGLIKYGPLTIDQRVQIAEKKDFMTNFQEWLSVQNGSSPEEDRFPKKIQKRFISTPRDLATYVHIDQLYQAYLNACLLLLEMKAPFDSLFNNLSGQGQINGRDRQAGGFALWGGPHILTLVTEVATRALKAVRYQKFNIHLRLRPEALAGRIEKADSIATKHPSVGSAFLELGNKISQTVNKTQEKFGSKLLPMAFPEGSPMHPSYGAGHATVAGACVTVLKAYFDTSAVLVERKGKVVFTNHREQDDEPVAFYPKNENANNRLVKYPLKGEYLTLEGELNKLAANISIGRNMAGVHYFSDYYDSIRMGEKIAEGLLEEQAHCYCKDEFIMSYPTFDGPTRVIRRMS